MTVQLHRSNVPPGTRVFRVSELNDVAAQALQRDLGRVWVEGEISGWSDRNSSGHIYFTLKDAGGCLSAALWKSNVNRLPAGVTFRNGLAVIACGQLTVYSPAGRYQLIAERLLPVGLGAADEALRLLKEKLLRLGYFAPDRKRRLPAYPRRVAVVTSASGDAIRDILEIFCRRWPTRDVVVCPVRVQGDGAAEEIAAALDRLNAYHAAGHLAIDAIIVGRGGGSREDLRPFDAECVAQAIFGSAVPVISGIGHEPDVSVADLVADVRGTTPTNAAEECTRYWAEIDAVLATRRKQLADSLLRTITTARRRLDALAARRVFREPRERLRDREQRLDELGGRLRAAAPRWLSRQRDRLAAAAARLAALSPVNVLARGYSLTQTGDRALVRDAADVAVGEIIVTRLHRGRLTSRVLSIDPPDEEPRP